MDCYMTDYNVGLNDVALEDSIMKKGSLTTAGSKILDSFIAPFDAAVVERLREAGIKIVGKTKMDEFGIPGGSDELSGAAQSVINGGAKACLCNDLFGRYRREAAQNEACYIHPTYGTVSRYGLIPLASSMDQLGVFCNSIADGFEILSVIAGNDCRDGAMLPDKRYEYQPNQKELRVFAPANIISQADNASQDGIRAFLGKHTAVDGTLDYFDAYKQTMYVLSSAEISNNINRYDGIKFGYRSANSESLENLYTNTRTEALELQTKLAAIIGAMVLSAEQYTPYYEKAMKIRRLIKQSLGFDKYDLIALPSSIEGCPYDNLSLCAATALAGLPSVSFSYGGCGIQLIAQARNESVLLAALEGSVR